MDAKTLTQRNLARVKSLVSLDRHAEVDAVIACINACNSDADVEQAIRFAKYSARGVLSTHFHGCWSSLGALLMLGEIEYYTSPYHENHENPEADERAWEQGIFYSA